jgi:cytochrome c biogenesis protein CcdA
MDFGFGTFALGFGAGVLSTLSPCVLPLVPILVATATAQHRFGALALAAGLTLSFTAVGLFLATIGLSVGLDQGVMRKLAALMLIAFGFILLSSRLQARFASLTSGLGSSAGGWLQRFQAQGWSAQFVVGLLLGLVWTPCVGPTLGATTALAAQGAQLSQVALLMLLFGLGAGTPLVVLGSASREIAQHLRGRLTTGGQLGKLALGVVMLLLGISILTGLDKSIEAFAVDVSPAWLNRLTTRY